MMDILENQFQEIYMSLGGKKSELEKEDGEYTHSKSQMAWEIWKFKEASSLDLTGHDIKYISDFMCYDDLNNLDTEVTIQKCKSGFDGAGIYAWVTEYPEEGGIKLGDQVQDHDS